MCNGVVDGRVLCASRLVCSLILFYGRVLATQQDFRRPDAARPSTGRRPRKEVEEGHGAAGGGARQDYDRHRAY